MKTRILAIRFSLTLSFLLFVLFAQAAPLSAQGTGQFRNTISGHVFDPNRRPVMQIPVELLDDFNRTLSRTRTNSAGRYFFPGLSAGRFYVKVMPLGTNLEEQTQEVEIVNFVRPTSGGSRQISAGENAQKDFYLRVIRSNKNEPGNVNSVVFAQDVPEPARKVFESAVTDLESQRTDAAVQGLENAIRLFPDYYLALEILGGEYVKQRKYENAREVLSKAVTINSRGFHSWYGLGFANYGLKRFKEAAEASQKAVTLNPESALALLILGISQRQLADYSEAEKTLLLAKKVAKGKVPDVHWNLALLYAHNLKRYKEAADELELFLNAQPDSRDEANIKKLIAQLREKSVSN